MKQRKPVNRISAKKLAQLGGKMPHSTIARRGVVAKVNRKRRAKELERTYGSKAQREWMTGLPCWACHALKQKQISRTEQAHMANGGMGRKADASFNLPLCHQHHEDFDQHRPPFNLPELRQKMLDDARVMYSLSPDSDRSPTAKAAFQDGAL